MPVISRDHWISEFFGNSLYLIAFGYYFVITFLGYNGAAFHLENRDLWLTLHRSIAIPASYGAFAVADRRCGSPVGH